MRLSQPKAPASLSKVDKAVTPSDAKDLAVVLCTYNPCREVLGRTLDSLRRQTLAADRYELIIVDNNSSPPLAAGELEALAGRSIRLVREGRQGLIFARRAGIRAVTAPLIVWIDDDNFLDPAYLETALEIAAREPEIGLFGGIAEPAWDRPAAGWKKPLLGYLGIRDYGDRPITSREPHWGHWEPIGAGMVARTIIARAYADFIEQSPRAGALGRKGNALLSCEDSLLARIANRLGYACSYQPALRLKHHMPPDRLKTTYLARLVYGMGRSYVRLEHLLDRTEALDAIGPLDLIRRAAARFKNNGLAGLVELAWDLGYRAELEDLAQSPAAAKGPAAGGGTSAGSDPSRAP